MTSDSSYSNTLLGTALVKVSSPNGHSIIARALVDSASNRTLINEDLAQKLSLRRHFSKYTSEINGISSTPVRTKGSSHVNLFTLQDKLVCKDVPVLILSKISNDLPSSKIHSSVREKLVNLHLADPFFDEPGPIQMIIGADLFMDIIKTNKLSLGENMPHALETIFGFVIIGRTPYSQGSSESNAHHLAFLSINEESSLHKMMTKFWQIEEPPVALKLTPDEIECEQHFVETHSRCPKTGKYIVKLPFKHDPSNLGQSFPAAKRRFLSLENKLKNEPERQKSYNDAMNDYLTSGHMSLCVQGMSVLESSHYVIPHLGVFKDTSSTTRLRVVFDASCKTSSGKSLNDILHVGPKLQNDLCSVIINFRLNKFVFTTDVKQMFRSIDVHENDTNFQLLLWRGDPTKELNLYKMNTVSFGLASSPYLANRVIKQLSIDEAINHPKATRALESHIYVDDLALGAQTLNEALTLQQDVIKLLEKGNFHLRKWTANHKDLLVNIPVEHQEQPVNFRAPDEPLVSVLGLQWVPSTDTFTFKPKPPPSCLPTKRSVLSILSQIWDPCGLVVPVILFAKSFMQRLWTLGCEWDAPLPNDLSKKWYTYLNELPLLQNLNLPRYLQLTDTVNIELHGFCDASEIAYAACVYIRTINTAGEVNTSLLLSKTKVAPLKNTSLPRLELCGALLLAQLLNYCNSLLKNSLQIKSIYAWSDSTIALTWIATPPYKLKTYVANRVAQIQELLPQVVWSHVSSSFNPADGASRGLFPSQLINNSLWWKGPEWLMSSVEDWIKTPHEPLQLSELPEVKTTAIDTLLTTTTTSTSDFKLLERFSVWGKLQRVVAYIFRFKHNASHKNDRITGFLSTKELEKATFAICRVVQQRDFSTDHANLMNNKPCTNRLVKLSPFIDEVGLIRVGGRLKHANIHSGAKHPILLPKSHLVTTLIIDAMHLRYLHAGPQLLQSIISQSFWILSSRSIIRSRIHKCMTCFRAKPITVFPKMADLPADRINPSPPFAKTGLDYAGPFDIKTHTLRRAQTVKAYLCIFVCFATKAIHIEVASDLTADTFTASLTRFIARRGAPTDVYLDNATNFVGAYNKLNKIKVDLLRDANTKFNINELSIRHSTKFHFNPPSAPHQGGLWESGVKSAKTLLKKVMGQTILTLEEFQTLSVRVESILNSRPLCPLTTDPTELDVLTPGHFLIGRPLTSLPETDLEEVPLNRLKRWQSVQAFSQRLWKRWHREYLHTLQQRAKWTKNSPNILLNDIVLIHENSPPQTWHKGRVIAIHPGSDGVTRVVTLRTANGEVKRPVVKLSPLPHY